MFNEILTGFIFYINKAIIIKQKLSLQNRFCGELPSEAVSLCSNFYAYIPWKHLIGTSGAQQRKYFLKTSSDSIWYLLSYMCELCRAKHIKTPFWMFKVERIFGNFYGLRYSIFIAFFNVSWSSEVCSGMPLHVHT